MKVKSVVTNPYGRAGEVTDVVASAGVQYYVDEGILEVVDDPEDDEVLLLSGVSVLDDEDAAESALDDEDADDEEDTD